MPFTFRKEAELAGEDLRALSSLTKEVLAKSRDSGAVWERRQSW